ncbi:MAG: MauE/DoxX family redox-associated membrane protein [Bacteroidota bacterium]|nr:MauE/DoxX family redox-associated membrane protein [Bacteroidota bacterium]MDP4193164.1 MauE/DoxX family redox-associated membrane protein [Bacteroidota bacterium]MDP4195579.1 MauE/DoxX family redox-associated membrane protein [Bacteroidota bacterium]
MKSILTKKYLLLIARLIPGVIFIFAGMEKISDPTSFAKAIYDYKIFPELLINFFALAIPWIEVVSGLLLVFGIWVRENAFILNALLLVFIILILISILRGLNIECGCFGTASGSRVGWRKILENVALLIPGIYLTYFENIPLQQENRNV